MGIEVRRLAEFFSRFFLLPFPLEGDSELVMSLGVVWTGTDRRLKLCDRSLQVAGIQQAPSGTGGQHGGLHAGFFFGDLLAGVGFRACPIIVSLSAQYGGKGGVGAGKIGLQADASRKAAAASLSFPCCFSTVPSV